MRFRITWKQMVQVVACVILCLIVCGMAFANRTLVMEPAIEFLFGRSSFEKMTDIIQRNYLSDRLRWKDELLSLNGGYARLQGRTRYNEVQLMTNGMLTSIIDDMTDTTKFADNLSRFYHFLERKGIPFLFVMAPYKGPMEESYLPEGVTDMTNAIGEQAVLKLIERNVPVLDLRKDMSQNYGQIEKYFYRTDHHWNAEGAFFAYQRIMDAVQERFPGTKMSYTDSALWEKYVIPNWWLGSHGRRVGSLFAGVEDLDYILPAFETEMSRYSPGSYAYKGDFRRANIREWYIENSNYMRMDSYFRYLGGGYSLTYHRNQRAENRKRILLIGDSFEHPVECFLSTEFTSIDVLNPREYGKMSEADYVTLNPPDMVIMLNYPGTVANGYFSDFGEGKNLEIVGETLWDEIAVSAASEDMDYEVLPIHLESGKSYQLNLEKIQIEKGAPEGASVLLYDGGKVLDLTIFDIEYGNESGFHWGFQIPEEQGDEGKYELRLYAGITGGTEGVELVYQGIRLRECLLTNQ